MTKEPRKIKIHLNLPTKIFNNIDNDSKNTTTAVSELVISEVDKWKKQEPSILTIEEGVVLEKSDLTILDLTIDVSILNDIFEYNIYVDSFMRDYELEKALADRKFNYIEIYFGDNDFSTSFKIACQMLTKEILNGAPKSKFILQLNETLRKYTLETIKSAIVNTAVAVHMAKNSIRLYSADSLDISHDLRLLDYFKNIDVSLVSNIKSDECFDSDICYIDIIDGNVFIL